MCCGNFSYSSEAKEPPEVVQFNKHIRPILSEKCLHCHGADKNAREADLRLDDPQIVKSDRDGLQVVVAGNPSLSELYRRITTDDLQLRMPPKDSGKSLNKIEINLIRQWIEQGGQYQQHWSFLPPVRPAVPTVQQTDWPRNAIDHFMLKRLEQVDLRLSPAADSATLLRRVTLDLTGLPPSLEEIDAFLADQSPQAYERVVDRLLNSLSYGEHMARYWLDTARYADTDGYFTDDERSMWRWRDWVIDAFNRNMPFDQFTVEQLAGDLLPQSTEAQRIATGFNRNHMTTYETGVIDEEYRVQYVADRLEATATTWLGLTVGCARCHDHKYDPISQQEYYQLFAFFNNGPEKGNTGRSGNAAPVLELPTTEFTSRLLELRQQLIEAEKAFNDAETELASAQTQWEQSVLRDLPPLPTNELVAYFDMESSANPSRFLKTDSSTTASNTYGVERSSDMFGSAASFAGDGVIATDGNVNLERDALFSFGVWIKPSTSGPACILSKNDDVNSLRGFDLMLRKGKAVVHLIHKWNSDAIQVIANEPVKTGHWQHLAVTYDGSGTAAGIAIYINGKHQPVEVRYDNLHGSIKTDQPLRIGRRSTSAPFTGLIDEVRVYERQVSSEEVKHLASGQLVRAIVAISSDLRTPAQDNLLRQHYLANAAAEKFRRFSDSVTELRKQLQQAQKSTPTTMVMEDLRNPRETFLLVRGEYNQPGEKVTPKVPAVLQPLSEQSAANRLSLARWLVDPKHPLTSRVVVNRFWQQYFGTGIVRTVEDFGTRGEWPSHPELLDWLAVEFIESGWDVKHIQRLIVNSSAYRQASSTVGAAAVSARLDPDNRLLARGARYRLDAEMIRDNALAISGLLVETAGGPSVKPYQPTGLWAAVSYDGNLKYQQDHGGALYRRSMYTFWKRQSPPPAMLIFDAPTRETCIVNRPRTNTPLQALVLMNDTTYVEAARTLAQRMMSANPDADNQQLIQYGFRLATARYPLPEETDDLTGVFQQQLTKFQNNPQLAQQLLRVGESQRNQSLDLSQHAAWTIVASIILNLDETVTKH